MFVSTDEDLSEITISVKSNFSSSDAWYSALAHSASAVGAPYFARIDFSTEPELTPMRIGIFFSRQICATAFTRSSPPMLPGLMRILSTPACAASSASL